MWSYRQQSWTTTRSVTPCITFQQQTLQVSGVTLCYSTKDLARLTSGITWETREMFCNGAKYNAHMFHILLRCPQPIVLITRQCKTQTRKAWKEVILFLPCSEDHFSSDKIPNETTKTCFLTGWQKIIAEILLPKRILLISRHTVWVNGPPKKNMTPL